jgi:phosphomannomutase
MKIDQKNTDPSAAFRTAGIKRYNIDPAVFKAYDIRAVYPSQIDEEKAFRIAQAYVKFLTLTSNPCLPTRQALPEGEEGENRRLKIVLGRDVRESGPLLLESFQKGLLEAGADVVNIGVVSTDLFYFAVGNLEVDGGVTISASHNPREYNGFNMARKNAVPISLTSGLAEIRDLACSEEKFLFKNSKGSVENVDVTEKFLEFVASFGNLKATKPLKIVCDANFGMQAKIFTKFVEKFNLPVEIVPLNGEPDGTFPKGHPNPLLQERRKELCDLVVSQKADLGVAWDADGDRCFFVDEKGRFLEGYFTTAVLAEYILKKHGKGKIVIDPRLVWASKEVVEKNGGEVVLCKPGMTIFAQKMRETGALFAGENSAHYYFPENNFRDNGLIPLMIMLSELGEKGVKMSSLYDPFLNKYFTPGEINFKVSDAEKILARAEEKYQDGKIEKVDGLSVEYENWRFNLRSSNTEALLRLNLEARSREVMEEKVKELKEFIESFG